ncbi:MAG: hypothetical protein GY816_21250 [Cytophagales bacterium]|nr:hypothetical protein [Cytophagales bacterium]
MISEKTKSTLKELLESAPLKVRMEIMMHMQMAEGHANTKLSLSKELQEMLKKTDDL